MTATEIIILRGLPASGKTTYANSQKGYVRVSRDDIRRQLTGRFDKFAGDNAFEQTVSTIQKAQVRALLTARKSVIIDDMNLRDRYVKDWIKMADALEVGVDVVNFPTPLVTLIERNRDRVDKVDEQFIIDTYAKFPPEHFGNILTPTREALLEGKYVPNPDLPKCITVDLDGTLARHHRDPYDTSRYHTDTLHEDIAEITNGLWSQGYRVVILTGRSADFKDVCEQWLADNGVMFDSILMRASGDTRRDSIIKVELFREHIAPHFNHRAHFDDRQSVVEAMRNVGVRVLEAAPGFF